MGRGHITLAGVQFAGLQGQKERNIDAAGRLVRQAAAAGAQVVLTPEVSLTGFVGGDVERDMAEPIPGPATGHFSALARELSIYILLGLSEMREGYVHNAIAVLDPRGELIGVMRKVHINKFETSGGWRNGSEFPVWRFETETGSMSAGVMICYDREVPEAARVLMLQGCDVIFNPFACTCPTMDIHRCLLRTRAFENEMHILVVNHAAPRLNGHSMAINPDGDIAQELDESEGILQYVVDLDQLAQLREGGIYGRHHRRPELYHALTDPSGQVHPENANLPRVNEPGRSVSLNALRLPETRFDSLHGRR
ncbi:MAG TPA: carbon-nitrogen hydrolase family protein [Armatimonadota bacterium]|nr:carbon-nitrogen hydrolase family protein [Armatimonadota bacterium]